MFDSTPKVVSLIDKTVLASENVTAVIKQDALGAPVLKVEVSAKAGTSPTLDIVLQTTDDGGSNWYDVVRLAQVTANTTHPIFVPLKTENITAILTGVGDGTLSANSVSGLGLLSSNVRIKVTLGGSTTAAVSATGNITVTGYANLSGKTITVDGHVLTEGVDFTAATDNATTAASILTAIQALTGFSTSTALSASITVNFTAGAAGNGKVIATNSTAAVTIVSPLAGGADAIPPSYYLKANLVMPSVTVMA